MRRLRTLPVLFVVSCASAEARNPKGDELILGEALPLLPDEAPPAVVPDGTCEVLAQVFAATPDSLVALRGGETEATNLIGSPMFGEGPRHDSAHVLPGYTRCQVIGPRAGGVAAHLICDRPTSADPSVSASDDYRGRVEQIGVCLDPQYCTVEGNATTTSLFCSDPRLPRIEVALRSSGVQTTVIAATPPLLPPPAEFCPALDTLVQKLGPTFEGTSQPALPLPGMASCRYDDKQVDCTAYAGGEMEVARSSYRHVLLMLANCLPGEQWTAEQSDHTTTFQHRTEKARVITVHQDWNPAAVTAAAHTLGLTEHGVGVTLGPSR